MARINYQRANMRDQARHSAGMSSPAERGAQSQAETANIIAGMGQGRYSPAADQFMAAEPVRRIDPHSPEGRAIAARYSG